MPPDERGRPGEGGPNQIAGKRIDSPNATTARAKGRSPSAGAGAVVVWNNIFGGKAVTP